MNREVARAGMSDDESLQVDEIDLVTERRTFRILNRVSCSIFWHMCSLRVDLC